METQDDVAYLICQYLYQASRTNPDRWYTAAEIARGITASHNLSKKITPAYVGQLIGTGDTSVYASVVSIIADYTPEVNEYSPRKSRPGNEHVYRFARWKKPYIGGGDAA